MDEILEVVFGLFVGVVVIVLIGLLVMGAWDGGQSDAGRIMYREACAQKCAPKQPVVNTEGGWDKRNGWMCACGDVPAEK